ncbi:hypothetical protein IWQ51_005009 [Labrenzia sp. EL_142]|nr:hypothetical protein [Labrenzia sp. EL_142]
MKIPKIDKRLVDRPILLGSIKIDLGYDILEDIEGLLGLRKSTTNNEKLLQTYFASLLGLSVFQDACSTLKDAYVYNFSVTDISNESGAASFDFLGPVGLIPWLLIPPTVSVSLKGSLTDAKSGDILTEANKTNSFETNRTFFNKKIKSLPMIEVTAVGLLMELKQNML